MAEKEAKQKGKGSGKQKKAGFYKLDGTKLIRKRTCPKCGPGVFMAIHEKRQHCGKCGYTEFK